MVRRHGPQPGIPRAAQGIPGLEHLRHPRRIGRGGPGWWPRAIDNVVAVEPYGDGPPAPTLACGAAAMQHPRVQKNDVTGLDLTSAEYYFGTSWDYDWSPDGTFVVYRDENELWIYDTLNHQHAVVPTTVSNQPRWSPDGTRIVYGASAGNWTTIESIDLDDLSITVLAKAKNRYTIHIFFNFNPVKTQALINL